MPKHFPLPSSKLSCSLDQAFEAGTLPRPFRRCMRVHVRMDGWMDGEVGESPCEVGSWKRSCTSSSTSDVSYGFLFDSSRTSAKGASPIEDVRI